ncbi:TPA: phage tail protein [Streptococcus pyogenes]|nr:phage tail protein [Streptococcus pyogenes]
MITLYKSDETNFEHNGLGRIDNEARFAEAEEEINGLYSYVIKYPIKGRYGSVIKNQMLIKAPTPYGTQIFRIYRLEPSMGMLTITCLHIFYDLAFNFIEDTNIINKSGQAFLQQLGNSTQYKHPFQFFSDIATVSGSRIVRKNCVEILLNGNLDNSFVSRYGGEILRDNFTIYFNKAIGRDRNFKITYRKNLKGYKAKIDDKSVITRIMPIGFNGLLLPEKYIDSPRIKDYPFPRIGKLELDVKAAVGEYADDEDAVPIEEAYEKMRQLTKEQFGIIDVPTTSYDVDFIELSKTKEYENFKLLETVLMGDTVTVDHSEDNFHVSSKIIKYKFDGLKKRFTALELGQFESRASNSNINQKRSFEQKIRNVVQEAHNLIQVAANKKNTIYRGADRPNNANVGDLWYQPDGQNVIAKQWSGTDWEIIPFGGENFGNININDLSGNAIDIKQFRLANNNEDILFINQDGEVVLNVKHIHLDTKDVATLDDLKNIEGKQGPPGISVTSVVKYYLLSDMDTGITHASSGWQTEPVTMTETKRYLWTYDKTIYSNGMTTQTVPVVTGAHGQTGIGSPGKPGTGISSTNISYASSTSGTTAPLSGWQPNPPTVPNGQYLWTKTVWNYTNQSSQTAYSVSKMGEVGPPGSIDEKQLRDITNKIESKLDATDANTRLDELSKKTEEIRVDLEARAIAKEVAIWKREYDNQVADTERVINSFSKDFIDSTNRITAIEAELRSNALLLNFVNTYLRASDEGVILGNSDNSEYIELTPGGMLIKSAGEKVMTFANGQVKVLHGVFVETLQISHYRFEPSRNDERILLVRFIDKI